MSAPEVPDAESAPDAVAAIERLVLGEVPSLTRVEVCRRADVPLETAEQLWSLLGFPHVEDDEVAFTPADVDALRQAEALVGLGVLSPERQAALVRTWGRSFARLADWQSGLLATVALERGEDPGDTLDLTASVLPLVESLQAYVWRRHLVQAGARQLATLDADAATSRLAVGFVDIVGYTSRSKDLDEAGLVAWVEGFEAATTGLVVDAGGQVVKTIGDEVLYVVADVRAAARIALRLVERGADPDDEVPEVRAGVAYGEVVRRLGDVFGETVNVASRLTTAARPGTVLVDRGVHDTITGAAAEDDDTDHHHSDPEGEVAFRRVRRLSVKGYSRLPAWALRAAGER